MNTLISETCSMAVVLADDSISPCLVLQNEKETNEEI